MSPDIFKNYLLQLQASMCQEIQAYENTMLFTKDSWEREQGGGGLTCVLQRGEVFESAGVNFSLVHGQGLPPSATAIRPELAGRSFKAMGVSSVIHPRNPFAPTAHMNVRLFVAEKEGFEPVWWFGGGFDLTPYYPEVEDCVEWHKHCSAICEPYGPKIYPTYKNWADEYFYLAHRKEPRGIGGLFFDDLNDSTWGWDWKKCLEFTQAVGKGFFGAYMPLVKRHYQKPYTEAHRDFQAHRRGRYVEFNLIYDRGTLFGLQSGGRTESILMSLPPSVSWSYNYSVGNNDQKKLLDFLSEKDWLNFNVEKAGLEQEIA